MTLLTLPDPCITLGAERLLRSPGAAAAEISSSARPEAATGRTTRVQSSDLTLPLKTRADSFMRRRHGGARVAERT